MANKSARVTINLAMLIAIMIAVFPLWEAFGYAEMAFADPSLYAPQQTVAGIFAVFYAIVALIVLVAVSFLRIEIEIGAKGSTPETSQSLPPDPGLEEIQSST